MKINKENLNITIEGCHNFFTPFILTNVYGIDLFNVSDANNISDLNELGDDELYDILNNYVTADVLLDDNYYEYDRTKALADCHSTYLPLLRNINDSIESNNLNADSPDEDGLYSREIKFTTSGRLEDNSIIYGDPGDEMKLSVTKDGATLERQDKDGICLYFEQGKRSAVTICNPYFDDEGQKAYFQISLETLDLKSNLLCENPYVEISYTVDINGIPSERTQFVLKIKGEEN